MSSPPEKRCLYEVLGLSRDSTADEIRSAYRKLALRRHHDKLVESGLSQAEATAIFQELVNAYEVLSDPTERAWYDSHRSQILFSGSDRSGSGSDVPDLFPFFSKSVFSGYSDSGKGFFKVYSEVFDNIYSNELNFAKKLGLGVDAVMGATLMGNLGSPYVQVTAFYNYWFGFQTVMDFCWVDQYDVMAGPNRKSRRVMEEENKKARKKARREYNDMVRSLVEFVKKRDKRVIDMQMNKNEEMKKKREEQRRKKGIEREKLEQAMAYEEPESAKVEDDREVLDNNNEIEDEKKNGVKELFCVVCRKKFKSEKQRKNHEQSKKHKEKAAELRDAFSKENIEDEGEEKVGEDENGGIDELSEKFEDSFQFQDQANDDEKAPTTEEEADSGDKIFGPKKVKESFVSDDDDASILKALVSGHKSRKNARAPKAKTSTTKTDSTNERDVDMDSMAYNDLKNARSRRATRGDRGRRYENDEEATTASRTEVKSQVEETNVHEDDVLCNDETTAHASVGEESNGVEDGQKSGKPDISKQPVNQKGTDKKDVVSKSKNSSKGNKQKATSKSSSSVCNTCGVDFESRNKLYKHLGDSGHATLKSR